MTFENSLHYLSFGDRPTVKASAPEYDSIILPSHLIIGGQGKIPTLINTLVKEEDIDYYIKPAITEFRAGTNFLDGEGFSPWFEKLVDYYGSPISEVLSSNSHLRFRNISESTCRGICSQVAEFQETFVRDIAEEAAGKYEEITDDLVPKAIIPWFELISEVEDVTTNRKIIRYTQSATDQPIKPCVFVKLEFLGDINHRKAITSMLDDEDISEVFLWVDELAKSETNIDGYLDVIDLVNRLFSKDIHSHFFYGNYFSNLLQYFGVTGTGFGVFHSESKSEKLEQSGGGGDNLNRYYFDPAKEFLSLTDIQTLIRSTDPPVCECSVCSEELGSWMELYRVADDWEFLQPHYVSVRRLQKERVAENSLKDLLESLKEDEEQYVGLLEGTESTKTLYHLRKWRKSIEIYVEKETDSDLEEYTSSPITTN